MVRITTLIENSPGEHLALRPEHGLSFAVETQGRMVLFDTGQSGLFIDNAAQLRIDVGRAEHVVLSHGHYDHSGGLRSLRGKSDRFSLIVGRGFFEEKYAERNGGYEFLGNNFDKEYLADSGIPYEELSVPTRELLPGLFAVGSFPRIHADELINPRFKLLKDGSFQPDRFDDEIMLVADTPKGLIALMGCAHPGMRNMLDAVRSRFGKPIYAVLGGTHLVEASEEPLSKSIEYLRDSEVRAIGVSHCTGAKAMGRLDGSDDRYFHNRCGTSLVID